jgi:hypothetical protein
VWLGKCDLYKGYNQVRLDEAAQQLPAVRTGSDGMWLTGAASLHHGAYDVTGEWGTRLSP